VSFFRGCSRKNWGRKRLGVRENSKTANFKQQKFHPIEALGRKLKKEEGGNKLYAGN